MLRIVICDDNEAYSVLLQSKLETCLREYYRLDCRITCLNTLEALAAVIDSNEADIVFLDIMLGDENAMDWSIAHLNNNKVPMIYMTSFPQAAYNLSESNCCYFLIKQKLTDEMLSRAVDRALQKRSEHQSDFFVVKTGKMNHVLTCADVLYAAADGNHVILYLQGRESLRLYSGLQAFSKRLPDVFLLCHKSYLVNMAHITGYAPHHFCLDTGETIPIPPKRYKQITAQYEAYQMQNKRRK